MLPAWPFVTLVSLWFMFLLPKLRGPYLVADSFEYMGALNQVRWVLRSAPLIMPMEIYLHTCGKRQVKHAVWGGFL